MRTPRSRANPASVPRGQISCTWSVAFGALHSALQPGLGVDVRGRVHAFGRIAYDVNDLGPTLGLVEAVGAIGDVRDALVALADRQANRGARRLEFEAF